MPDENEEVQVNIARIMIPKVSVAAVHADDTVRQGLEIMKYHRYTSIPVLDAQDVYLGSVTEGDFLLAAAYLRFPGGTDFPVAGAELRSHRGRQGLHVWDSHQTCADTPS